MPLTRRGLLISAFGAASGTTFQKTPPPKATQRPGAYGAIPSARQLRWHELETTAFLHFTVNTFTNKEWGYGDEDPNLFNPTNFDADAIVSALASAGMRGVILTAKHHDGFCLWPTQTTEHSVQNSAWRAGKGDVVRDLSGAARRAGLSFGVYLSPWDRNNSTYGSPAYIDIYRRQLTELLTNYGSIFEVWHDGANGGDGYYGGARAKRTIDKRTYYDWPKTWALVRKLQPDAVIFSDVGPDVRWVGNERGIAGDPCWATYDPVGADGGPASPGDVRERESPVGHRHGAHWLPAECDVSIRPGWFWHEAENAEVKSAAALIRLYYNSVGRGANLLLNVPPNREGLLSKEDIASLREFGNYRRATFARNLALDAKTSASSERGTFTAANLLDARADTYWAADEAAHESEVAFDLPREASFSVIRVAEAIRFGQRVDAIAVDRWNGSAWDQIAAATSVGPHRMIRLAAPVAAQRVRLRVTQASASPVLSEFALFAEP
ncbi:MAG: alpha-L-fucosidase [Bryobacteraceae bacterium]